jgi:hypothetical protein
MKTPLFRTALATVILLVSTHILAACTLTPAAPAVPGPDILFQDDFSSDSSNWDDYADESGATEYRKGAYRIFVNIPETDFWANPAGLSFQDVKIQVEARRVGGAENNVFGILCRYQDSANFYQLLVSSDGYYDISKVKDNHRLPLTGDQLLPSEAIPRDASPLLLGADCLGESLVLYVNGVEIARASDTEFQDGNVGLIAGAFAEPGTDITFDNFVVRQP